MELEKKTNCQKGYLPESLYICLSKSNSSITEVLFAWKLGVYIPDPLAPLQMLRLLSFLIFR